jgi:hypothetical protein
MKGAIMESKCDKYKDLLIILCKSGLSYSDIHEQLPEKIAIGTIWRYFKKIGLETSGFNKAAFKKGNKTGEKKRKEITYEVNENGCWICTSHKLTKAGYAHTRIKGKHIYIHRLFYEQKYGEIPFGLEACHKCDNPACINPDHLFLGTHFINMQDRTTKGRDTNGKRNGCAKLTETQVKELLSLKHLKQLELANMFNIAQPTVSGILHGKSWQHLQNDEPIGDLRKKVLL